MSGGESSSVSDDFKEKKQDDTNKKLQNRKRNLAVPVGSNLPLLKILKTEESRKTSTASGTDSENVGPSHADEPKKKRKQTKRERNIVKNAILKRHVTIKYELMHKLTKFSPDPENFALFSNVREITQFSTSAISKYLTEEAKKHEASMVALQTDQTFQNLHAWSDYMTHIHGRPSTNSAAFVTKMIAETEQHPSPEEAGGVDYKAIYNTMAALMKGHPISELNDVSKQVLVDLYKELMDDVKSDAGLKDLRQMHQVFLAQGTDDLVEVMPEEELGHALLDTELNPFQMTLKMVQRRDDILAGGAERLGVKTNEI